MTVFRKALVLAIIFATVAGCAALLNAVPLRGVSLSRAILGVGSFGCFGFLLGGIYAFDPESDLKIKSSSIGRILFGVAAALLLSVLWRWSLEASALAAISGATLAYFGMAWAKYAEF
ncbi:hypothetical protein ACHAC9_23590 [Massilia sp. CMS3.1]|uniref:hypothetical protein n=1 Tax=Massilia sp. CMS3.1 TaxID=3373083 RepID=UPI003EE5F241